MPAERVAISTFRLTPLGLTTTLIDSDELTVNLCHCPFARKFTVDGLGDSDADIAGAVVGVGVRVGVDVRVAVAVGVAVEADVLVVMKEFHEERRTPGPFASNAVSVGCVCYEPAHYGA